MIMNQRHLGWAAMALACLLASGCGDRHAPVKPTVQHASRQG